jgi:hypothetical protein
MAPDGHQVAAGQPEGLTIETLFRQKLDQVSGSQSPFSR